MESTEQHIAAEPAAEIGGASYRRKRVWEEWEGNEVFFLDGRLVAGPNFRACVGTAFALLAPAGIFLAFVAPYVAKHVHVIILVFSCLLPVLCAVFLFMTACRDPGIIPRQEPNEEYLTGRQPRTKEVEVNGQRVVIRYNDTCHFYQPPRAHHCSVADNCYERFDHHCPWVGTTIGKRNYRTFLLFVFTATVLCLYVMGVCLAQLFLRHKQLVDDQRAAGNDVSDSSQWGQAFRDVIPALVLMFYCFIFMWFVGGLSGFHIYLSATNQTTYENFRYNQEGHVNPYDRGLLNNCAEIWCMPIPPSQVQFRAFLDEWPYPRPPQQEAEGDNEYMGNGTGAQADFAPSGGEGQQGGAGDVEMGHAAVQQHQPPPQAALGRGSFNPQQAALHRHASASLNPLYQQDNGTGGPPSALQGGVTVVQAVQPSAKQLGSSSEGDGHASSQLEGSAHRPEDVQMRSDEGS